MKRSELESNNDRVYLTEEDMGGKVNVTSKPSNEAASPIIKRIAYDVLRANKGQKISLRLIRHYVEQESGETFSSGSFSGAMRDLIEESKGRIVNVERGFYSYVVHAKSYEINAAIDRLIQDLTEVAYVNLLEAEDEDINAIKKIPDIQRKLYQLKIKS